MFKGKRIGHLHLTLLLITSAFGDEQTTYPKAREWPKYAEFEWGMSEREFYQVCEKKKLKRVPDPLYESKYQAKGIILGREALVIPHFGDVEGESPNGTGMGLKDLSITWDTTERDGEKLFAKLGELLRGKYGHPKVSRNGMDLEWGAPDMPHICCLRLGIYSDFKRVWNKQTRQLEKELTGGKSVFILYLSKSAVKWSDDYQKKMAAAHREDKKKAKEDEKDF